MTPQGKQAVDDYVARLEDGLVELLAGAAPADEFLKVIEGMAYFLGGLTDEEEADYCHAGINRALSILSDHKIHSKIR